MLTHSRRSGILALLALSLALSTTRAAPADNADGVVKVKSVYSFDDTIARLKDDIAGKGIRFFIEVDQTRLAADAGVKLHPSTLLIFGNPPLGTQFMTSSPNAGLDWPVRLLIVQDQTGAVWAIYTDFEWIKRRHHIADRDAQFKMAASVIASITASIEARP